MINTESCNRIVLCGVSAASPPLLGRVMRRSVSQEVTVVSSSAFRTTFQGDRATITTFADDLLNLRKIRKWSAEARAGVCVVVCIRDPRDVLLERGEADGCGYMMGYDHALHDSKKITTLTAPGLLYRYAAAEEATRLGPRVLLLRDEDLLKRPELVQLALAQFTGLQFRKPFARLLELEEPTGINAWERVLAGRQNKPDARRLIRQFRLAPEMFDLLARYDYEKARDRSWFDRLSTVAPEAFDDSPGTIVGFHTIDRLYLAEARRLRQSVEALRLPLDLTPIQPEKWLAAVQKKPGFLVEARRRLRGPLLYVDVDAVIHTNPWPYLRGYDGDVAVAGHQGEAIISGTVLINDTEGALQFLEEWKTRQASAPELWDQHCLEILAKRHKHGNHGVRVDYLPPEMCCVFNRRFSPPITPVIEHLQASREQVGDRPSGAMSENLAARRERLAELDKLTEESGLPAFADQPADQRERHTQRMRDQGASDEARWSAPANLKSAWATRAAIVAGLIPDGSTVLDLGCGAMDLGKQLGDRAHYIPADLVARDERTLIIDLNQGLFPDVQADVVTLLGVIEYIHAPETLLIEMAKRWPHAIVTYNPADLDVGRKRRAHGWFNDLTSAGFVSLAARAGYELVGIAPHGARERIYELKRA